MKRLGDLAARYRTWPLALVLAAAMLQAPAQAKDKTAPSYSYFVTGTQYFVAGNPVPIKPLPTPRPQAAQPVVLMGGGPDVDPAYRWMIEQAGITRATGGRFVVIRSTGTDAYDPYFYYSNKHDATDIPAVDGFVGGAYLGLTAAETLIITSRDAANDPFVNAVVASANALWIAGGDQSTYIALWKGTRLNTTIATLLQNDIPVGGTSAGANVLGQFVFSAANGTVTSAQALGDPYNPYMTFDPTPFAGTSFLNVAALGNTFVDPHFDSRDRMGRLVSFVGRTIRLSGTAGCDGGILSTSWSARGIGIDVETALTVQRSQGRYLARRMTNVSTTSTSAVHFLRPLSAPATCRPGTPLTMYGVQVQRFADSTTTFDLTSWWSGGGSPAATEYIVDENAGVQMPATIPY